MTTPEPGPTRRALLLGTAVALAGCTSARRGHVVLDADYGPLAAAWQGERLLLAAYAQTSAEHQAHLAHLHALEARLRPLPFPQPVPTTPVAADEQASVPLLQAAARTAHHGANAALLASIAASHAVLARAPR